MKKVLSAVTLLAAGAAHAAGIAIDVQSARATGMSTAYTSVSNDASSVYFNPAGLLGVEALDVQLGVSPIMPRLKFSSDVTGETTTSKFRVSPPPHAYAALRVHDKVAAGIGVFTGYGARNSWPEGWEGAPRALSSYVATFNVNPSVAYAPVPWVRLGAGFQAVRGILEVERQLAIDPAAGMVKIGGADWGYGYNAGIQVDIPNLPRKVGVGVHYRSKIDFAMKGGGDFQNVPLQFQERGLWDQDVSLDITTPWSLQVGAHVQATPRLVLSADGHLVGWHRLRQLYFEFADTPALSPPLPKNWENTWNWHLGAEFMATDKLALRAGAMWDPTPSPKQGDTSNTLTPDLPDSDRLKGTIGVGYDAKPFRADLGYQFLVLTGQKSNAPLIEGEYSGTAHVFSVTVGYRM